MKSKIQSLNRINYEHVDSIISDDLVFIGDITKGGSMRFEGNIKGTITIDGNLVVGRSALIIGTVRAKNVHVLGTIEGNVKCEQLKILSTGKVTGDAEVESIIIDEGAILIGNCRTVDEEIEEPSIEDILNITE